MRRLTWAGLVAGVALAGAMGCSTSPTDGTNPGGQPPGETGMPPSTTNPDLTPVTGGACNAVTDDGAPLVMDTMGANQPALAGGQMIDGRYVLTNYEWFDSRASLHQRKIVLEVSSNGTVGKYLWQRDQEPIERATVLINTAADKVSMRGVCPSGADLEWDRYGMESNGIVLFSTRDSKAAHFTRQ